MEVATRAEAEMVEMADGGGGTEWNVSAVEVAAMVEVEVGATDGLGRGFGEADR